MMSRVSYSTRTLTSFLFSDETDLTQQAELVELEVFFSVLS